MDEILKLLRKLGISKVELAKYLGVSRQMVYNYLASNDIYSWPKDKRIKLFDLFNVTKYEDLDKIIIDINYIKEVENRLNDKNTHINVDSSKLPRQTQNIIDNYVSFLAENAGGENDKILMMGLNFLQSSLLFKDIRFFLEYFEKMSGKKNVNYFTFDADKQYIFEGIIYSAISLYKNGGYSMSKVDTAHQLFEREVSKVKERQKDVTKTLSLTKIHALRELGYEEINDENAEKVFAKMAEIQARKI